MYENTKHEERKEKKKRIYSPKLPSYAQDSHGCLCGIDGAFHQKDVLVYNLEGFLCQRIY